MGILRQVFGASRKEIWQQLAKEVGGTYVEGGFARSDKVQVRHGEWMVTLDVHVVSTGKSAVVFTRMRAPYVNPDGFRFNIYREGFFSEIGKFFGMQDVEIGIEAFDRDFVIQGSDEARLRLLFDNAKLRELLEKQPKVQFCVRDDEGWFGPDFPEGVDELRFMVLGVIKDIDRLKGLYDLFAEALDQLCRIGSAYEGNPEVNL